MKKIQISLFALLLASSLYGQEDTTTYNYTENLFLYGSEATYGSARLRGMGGSMAALGGDLTASQTNPAGLGLFQTSVIEGSLNNLATDQSTSHLGLNSKGNENKFDLLGTVGGAIQFEGREGGPFKSYTLGVVSSNTSNVKTDLFINGNPSGPSANFGGYQYSETGTARKTSINLAANQNDQFYVGAGLNLYNTNNETFSLYNYVGGGKNSDGTTYTINEFNDKQGFPYHERSSGVSASIGFIAKIDQTFRVGASYQSPTWKQVEREEVFYEPSYEPTTYLSEYNTTTPGKFTVAAAAVIGKSLAINAEYSYQNWENANFKPSGNFKNENNFIGDFLGETNSYRIGAEARHENWRVRAGYRFDESPFKNATIILPEVKENGQTPATPELDQPYQAFGDLSGFSIGVGYDAQRWYADLAYQRYTQTRDIAVFGTHYSNVADATYDRTEQVFRLDQNFDNITATLGLRF
ncbi:MAG: hypothetical protein C4K58_04950 [Flavobacteriaceae bacterium]|nr:MAG: hypothetical protein C4K58_04950 [Flavobacteriaceae bacterium]